MKYLFKYFFVCYLVFAACSKQSMLPSENPSGRSLDQMADSLSQVLGIDHRLMVEGRHIPMKGPVNFRDLGGLRTENGKTLKWQLLYRSDALSTLTEGDIQLLDQLGLRTIIDFRTLSEVKKEPDVIPDGIDYYNLPVGQDNGEWTLENMAVFFEGKTSDSMEVFMTNIYKEMPVKWSQSYRTFFDIISVQDNSPLVFHCTAGKDRTGIASALLLYLLGVPREVIENEYELSNYYRHEANGKFADLFSQYGIDPGVVKPLMDVHASYLREVFEHIDQRYGSLDQYIEKELEVTVEEKKAIRSLYLN